jgi:hypothetical protein
MVYERFAGPCDRLTFVAGEASGLGFQNWEDGGSEQLFQILILCTGHFLIDFAVSESQEMYVQELKMVPGRLYPIQVMLELANTLDTHHGEFFSTVRIFNIE